MRPARKNTDPLHALSHRTNETLSSTSMSAEPLATDKGMCGAKSQQLAIPFVPAESFGQWRALTIASRKDMRADNPEGCLWQVCQKTITMPKPVCAPMLRNSFPHL